MTRFFTLAILLAAAGTSPGLAQDESSGKYFSQAFNRVTEAAKANAKLGNFGYSDNICILGAWLKKGDVITFGMPLVKDVPYMFGVAGDNDARDLGLEILDAAGQVVASEKRVAPDALVTYTPTADARFTLRLTLLESRNNLECICVACILKEKGIDVPLGNLDVCANRIIQIIADADKILLKDNKRVELRYAKQQWALYGSVLNKGEDAVVNNIDLGLGKKYLVALGDNNTKDVDLFLIDGANKVIAEDSRTTAEASIVFNAVQGVRYSLKMRNYDGRLAVVMSAVFDIVPRRKTP